MRNLVTGLALGILLCALAAFRGNTGISQKGDYGNDIRITANDTVIFSKTQTGASVTTGDERSVRFLDTYNGTAAELTLTIYTKSAPNHISYTAYVPALSSRSFPGIQIDSVAVAGTWGGGYALFGGMN